MVRNRRIMRDRKIEKKNKKNLRLRKNKIQDKVDKDKECMK